MKKLDLTSQFILYLVITLIGVIGAMNFWFYNDHVNHLTETLENRASAKLDYLASSTGYYITHFENELITELGKEAMLTDNDVVYLSIEDSNGIKLFEKGDQKHKDSLIFYRQIIRNAEKIGAITLALDLRFLKIEQFNTKLYVFGLMLFSVSLIGGIVYLFFRKVILYEFKKVKNEKEFLRVEHEFFMAIINTASNMVIVLDKHGYIMLINKICANALAGTADALTGKHITSAFDIDCDGELMGSGHSYDAVTMFESFHENLLHKHCRSLLSVNGVEIHVEWKFSKLLNKNGGIKSLIGTGVDITLQHQKQLELSHLAHHDQLTSLPNRTLFNDRLQESFKQAKRYSSVFAMLFIDLDNFKPVNDTYGHEAGDLVLKIVSQRMQSTIRDVDTIARLGGDEFGMLLFDVKDRINVSNLAEMLLEEISKPILYGEEILNIGASIGIAFYNEKTKDAKELVSQADTAMYQAKTAGRNTYSYFEKVTSLTNVTDINTKI